VRLQTIVYRAHHPRWAFLPESGDGAAVTGGRFNPVGVPALYTSLQFQTAWLEAQQAFPFKAQPMMLCAYEVDCEDVIDLTNAEVLRHHGIAVDDMSCPWKDMSSRGMTPPSWALATRLAAEGASAIVSPSFAAGAGARDINVVFLTWTRSPPHQVRVIDDDDRLPKDARSWR